jgi:hypothetical protein
MASSMACMRRMHAVRGILEAARQAHGCEERSREDLLELTAALRRQSAVCGGLRCNGHTHQLLLKHVFFFFFHTKNRIFIFLSFYSTPGSPAHQTHHWLGDASFHQDSLLAQNTHNAPRSRRTLEGGQRAWLSLARTYIPRGGHGVDPARPPRPGPCVCVKRVFRTSLCLSTQKIQRARH